MKKRFLPLVLALVMCLGLTVPALAAEAAIEEAIPCELSVAGPFKEGLAAAGRPGEDGVGFIDKTGKVVIPCVYDSVGNFSEGFAAVKQNDKWGFIDKAGKTVVSCKYDDVGVFSEDFAVVVLDGKCGFIDKTGKEVIPCEFSVAGPFKEGLAAAGKPGEDVVGFIDKTGEVVIPCVYESVGNFSEGLVEVKQNDKWGFIDKTGKTVVSCKYDYAYGFSDGLAMVKQNDKWGFIDKTGKEVISCKYENGQSFHEGLALVQQNGKWGYIDPTGKTVIDFQYDDAWEFSEGFAPVMKTFDGYVAWGYIDKTGKEVVPCTVEESGRYVEAGVFSDGMAWVAKLEKVEGEEDSYYKRYGYLAIRSAAEVTATVDDWAKEAVDNAAAAGLIAGSLGDNYTVSITRAQFAAVAVKLYEAMSGQAAPEAGDSPFSDTGDPAVIQAAALGIVGGNGDGTFNPNSQVTREDAATMLSRVYTKLDGEIPEVDATDFADDGAMNGYAKSAVAFMVDRQIINGVGDNRFDPQGKATIQEALIIAARMLENLK